MTLFKQTGTILIALTKIKSEKIYRKGTLKHLVFCSYSRHRIKFITAMIDSGVQESAG